MGYLKVSYYSVGIRVAYKNIICCIRSRGPAPRFKIKVDYIMCVRDNTEILSLATTLANEYF